MATMLRSLKARGRIELNVSGETRRDFLPDTAVVEGLTRAAQALAPGVFNFGSGVGTRLADLAAAAIRGFGSGELIAPSDDIVDPFVLDMDKWNRRYGPLCEAGEVLARVEQLGGELRRWQGGLAERA
jgi:hypothetical protein